MKTNILKLIKGFITICLLAVIFSCTNKQIKHSVASENIMLDTTGETPNFKTIEAENELALDEDETDIDKDNIDIKLKIIKNANCKIKVSKVEIATALAKQIAMQYQGYVSDERFINTNYSKENRFTIRIPQDRFDAVLDSICGLAEFVDHKNISTVDVTEEYVDITSRLKTKLEVKKRYETILRTKAKTVEDILKAEEKLNQVQEEIESAKGRLQYLSNKVAYSTIQLDMYETVIPKNEPAIYKPKFLDKASDGLSFGWSLIENLTLMLFYVWPFLLLGAMIYVYFKWIRK